MKTRDKARERVLTSLCVAAVLLAMAPDSSRSAALSGAPVNGARIANADAEPGNWLTYGRTYSEQRYSPLAKINDKNANSWVWPGLRISTPIALRKPRPWSWMG